MAITFYHGGKLVVQRASLGGNPFIYFPGGGGTTPPISTEHTSDVSLRRVKTYQKEREEDVYQQTKSSTISNTQLDRNLYCSFSFRENDQKTAIIWSTVNILFIFSKTGLPNLTDRPTDSAGYIRTRGES